MTKIWKKNYFNKKMDIKYLSEKCEQEKKNILKCLEKFKSSIKNKYCLFCREEISGNDHYCSNIESLEEKVLQSYFKISLKMEETCSSEDFVEEEKIIKENKKEIIEFLNEDSIKNKELFVNLRNKILAYSM